LLGLFIVKGARIRGNEVTFQDAGIVQKEGMGEERHSAGLGLIRGSEDFLLSDVEGFMPDGAEH